MIEPVQTAEELVSDFHSADNVTGAIHVWFLGQSCFLIKWNGFGLLLDPYLSDSMTRHQKGGHAFTRHSEQAVDPVHLSGVDLVTCCNAQPDHLDAETILSLRAANPQMKLVAPQGIASSTEKILGPSAPPIIPVNGGTYVKSGPFEVHAIHAANPEFRQDEGGNSLDLSYIIAFGPFAIFHAGDTLWHKALVKEVRRWPVNLAFLPINGKEGESENGYNMNGFESAAFAKAISTSLAVPCHFDMFNEGNTSPEEFETCCDRLHQRYRILELGQRMTMGPVTDPSAGQAQPSEEHKSDWKLGY